MAGRDHAHALGGDMAERRVDAGDTAVLAAQACHRAVFDDVDSRARRPARA
jgi:hypothetical protein